jgi:hypothetical protein
MSQQQTPAGWYPDPSGSNNVRYWDGAQWTEHVGAPAPQQGVEQQVNQTVDSVANAFQNTEGSQVVRLAAPYQEAFEATLQALPTVSMSIRAADPQQGVITASTGVSLTSWGEDLTIRLGAAEDGQGTELWMESKMKFGLVNWGKHQKNFQAVANAVQARLAGGGQPVQGQAPAPPGPGAATGQQPPTPPTPPSPSPPPAG